MDTAGSFRYALLGASWPWRSGYFVSQSDSSENELLAALARGHMPALDELVRRHQADALGFARRMLGPSDQVEDVVQDAFLRIYQAAGRYRWEAKFSTWLYQIVLNLCRDRLRRRRHAPIGLAEETLPACREEPLQRMEANEAAVRVRRAVGALPERQRTAVILHRSQELRHEEISEVTGWSVSAIESLLVRAYQRLREDLADLGPPNE